MDRTCKLNILDNGAKYVETHVPGELIYIEVFINVGWDDESDQTNGICHFLEHMNASFTSHKYPNASENRKKFDNYGVNTNAYTSSKTCGYHLEVHCRKSLEIVDLFMQSIVDYKLDESILTEEANAIRNELNSGYVDSAWYDFETTWDKTCFRDHIRAIEIKEQVKNVDHLLNNSHMLLEWRTNYYCPCEMTVSIAGDPECEQWQDIRTLVIDFMGRLQDSPSRINRSYISPSPSGRQDIHLDKVTSSKVRFLYHIPITCNDHHAKLCADIWRKVIVKGLSSRLYKLRYENDGMIYGIRVKLLIDNNQTRMSGMYIETTCKPIHVDMVCKRIQEELMYPPTQDELERVKNAMVVENAGIDYVQSVSKFGHMYGSFAHLHGNLISNKTLRQTKLWLVENTHQMFNDLIKFWEEHPPFVLCGHPKKDNV